MHKKTKALHLMQSHLLYHLIHETNRIHKILSKKPSASKTQKFWFSCAMKNKNANPFFTRVSSCKWKGWWIHPLILAQIKSKAVVTAPEEHLYLTAVANWQHSFRKTWIKPQLWLWINLIWFPSSSTVKVVVTSNQLSLQTLYYSHKWKKTKQKTWVIFCQGQK